DDVPGPRPLRLRPQPPARRGGPVQRQGARLPRTRPEVRQGGRGAFLPDAVQQARLREPRPRPRPRHRRPPAHRHALLHGAGRAARTSVNWAIGLVGAFYLMTIALGFGATALVGRERILAHDPAGNTAAPLLARELGQDVAGRIGGEIMLAFVASVAFATILA